MTKAPDGSQSGGWGSHQPALRAIAKFMPIRSVIEFGSGPYSTDLFLDPEAFPLLESLTSFEHNSEWAGIVVMGNDQRHQLIIASPENFAARSAGMKADFVFLDSGPTMAERLTLVPHCLTLAPVFAMHDCTVREFEHPGFKYLKAFNSVIQVVFASNTIDLSGLEL